MSRAPASARTATRGGLDPGAPEQAASGGGDLFYNLATSALEGFIQHERPGARIEPPCEGDPRARITALARFVVDMDAHKQAGTKRKAKKARPQADKFPQARDMVRENGLCVHVLQAFLDATQEREGGVEATRINIPTAGSPCTVGLTVGQVVTYTYAEEGVDAQGPDRTKTGRAVVVNISSDCQQVHLLPFWSQGEVEEENTKRFAANKGPVTLASGNKTGLPIPADFWSCKVTVQGAPRSIPTFVLGMACSVMPSNCIKGLSAVDLRHVFEYREVGERGHVAGQYAYAFDQNAGQMYKVDAEARELLRQAYHPYTGVQFTLAAALVQSCVARPIAGWLGTLSAQRDPRKAASEGLRLSMPFSMFAYVVDDEVATFDSQLRLWRAHAKDTFHLERMLGLTKGELVPAGWEQVDEHLCGGGAGGVHGWVLTYVHDTPGVCVLSYERLGPAPTQPLQRSW